MSTLKKLEPRTIVQYQFELLLACMRECYASAKLRPSRMCTVRPNVRSSKGFVPRQKKRVWHITICRVRILCGSCRTRVGRCLPKYSMVHAYEVVGVSSHSFHYFFEKTVRNFMTLPTIVLTSSKQLLLWYIVSFGNLSLRFSRQPLLGKAYSRKERS